ncbi:MAG: GntR family transcriptional regulator [Melioribacteraceae bacterium]|nr:GntR family transcriptional regulator [Melioribacteraceae bacterium]MCF8353788.1 GntR family transcriptional regulator [Melioribacteraceae bacterium]MCF8393624.1 GntR family transcriptional regulator [Melioribacteraceae bacterium]MCF8419434.1 GntR family transcriptional regulator [Melioribacteraceae bacterium]
MLLNLSDLSDEPLQSQISRQLRAKILSGEIKAETMLPSIRQLAREQKVSVITVQRGYEHLEREGLIHSRRGKGFFVSEIHKEAKKEMAVQRLTEMVKPQIKLAKEEGMTKEEIRKIFDELLKNF